VKYVAKLLHLADTSPSSDRPTSIGIRAHHLVPVLVRRLVNTSRSSDTVEFGGRSMMLLAARPIHHRVASVSRKPCGRRPPAVTISRCRYGIFTAPDFSDAAPIRFSSVALLAGARMQRDGLQTQSSAKLRHPDVTKLLVVPAGAIFQSEGDRDRRADLASNRSTSGRSRSRPEPPCTSPPYWTGTQS